MRKKRRLAILISGSGTTMESIIIAAKEGKLKDKIEVCIVLASDPKALGIKKAKKYKIPVFVIQRGSYPKGNKGQIAFGEALLSKLKAYNVDLVSQNGWLPLTPENVVGEYKDRIFNQHPGPLDPEHSDRNGNPLHFGGKGMHGTAVHAAVLEFSKRIKRPFVTEATIHKVSSEFDAGTVVMRKEVEIDPSDTPETLSKRVLPVEHALFIDFLLNAYKQIVRPLKRKQNLIKNEEEDDFYKSMDSARKKYPRG